MLFTIERLFCIMSFVLSYFIARTRLNAPGVGGMCIILLCFAGKSSDKGAAGDTPITAFNVVANFDGCAPISATPVSSGARCRFIARNAIASWGDTGMV